MLSNTQSAPIVITGPLPATAIAALVAAAVPAGFTWMC